VFVKYGTLIATKRGGAITIGGINWQKKKGGKNPEGVVSQENVDNLGSRGEERGVKISGEIEEIERRGNYLDRGEGRTT